MSSRAYRNNKKVEEVKEVIQNKSDAEIVKVLEYFENDVGKTINAFINDGGKEAIAKFNKQKRATKNNNKNNNPNDGEAATAEQQTAKPTNNNSNNKRPQTLQEKSNKSNINDLVASVISQSIAATNPNSSAATTPLLQSPTSFTTQSSFDNSTSSFDKFANSSVSSVGGIKFVVLGVENSFNDSINGSNSTISAKQQPSANVINNNKPVSVNNSSILHDKDELEKYQNELLKHASSISTASMSLKEEIKKSQITLNQSFAQLKQTLIDRQKELESNFNATASLCNDLLTKRERQAGELLKNLAQKPVSNEQAQNLKRDIKQFLSDKQIDEDFGRLTLLNTGNLEDVKRNIKSFGLTRQISDKYLFKPSANIVNNSKQTQQVASNIQQAQPVQSAQNQPPNKKNTSNNNKAQNQQSNSKVIDSPNSINILNNVTNSKQAAKASPALNNNNNNISSNSNNTSASPVNATKSSNNEKANVVKAINPNDDDQNGFIEVTKKPQRKKKQPEQLNSNHQNGPSKPTVKA